jgi:AcrR family transcriptional regulator
MTEDVLAADGRVIGTRAQATRRRLLTATEKLLNDHGVLELRVVDITREVGTSPATFYQYFADVDAAILALAEEAGEDEHPLLEHLGDGWDQPDGLARASAFVDAYVGYWRDHQAVLRVRNLKAEEGDPAFRKVRSRANRLVIEAMSDMVRDSQASGRLPGTLEPFATAAAMLAMIERLLAYQTELGRRGTKPEQLRDTIATILHRTLIGGA